MHIHSVVVWYIFRFVLKMYRQIESQRFHSPASNKHALIFFLFFLYLKVFFFLCSLHFPFSCIQRNQVDYINTNRIRNFGQKSY